MTTPKDGVMASQEPKGNRCGCSHWTKKTCPANNCPWQGKRPVDAHGVDVHLKGQL